MGGIRGGERGGGLSVTSWILGWDGTGRESVREGERRHETFENYFGISRVRILT